MTLPCPISAARCLQSCVAVIVWCGVGLAAGRAQGQGFAGQLSYTGSLGPVERKHPLCLCVYTDSELTAGPGCLKFRTNPAHYDLSIFHGGEYYLVAFLDIHRNEVRDADEPYEIYRDRAAPPGDPVSGTSGDMNVDLVFGDENVPGAPTPTSTASVIPSSPADSPTPTPSASPSPTPTPSTSPTPAPSTTATRFVVPTAPSTPRGAAGDCDGDGAVAIDELVRAIAIALEMLHADVCPQADLNGDGVVRTDELIVVVDAALGRRSQ